MLQGTFSALVCHHLRFAVRHATASRFWTEALITVATGELVDSDGLNSWNALT